MLASLHLELKALSGDVVKAGLGSDQHQLGSVALDEIILRLIPMGSLNFLEKKKTVQLRLRVSFPILDKILI